MKKMIQHGAVALVVTMLLLAFMFPHSLAHAASTLPNQASRVTGQTPVHWGNNGGCTLAQVTVQSIANFGTIYCFYLSDLKSWGYLGLGDPAGPGNIAQVFEIDDPYAGPGWIRYYGGAYPNGTYCRFGNGQYIHLPNVYVTQIALNISSSYHQCP